LQQLELNKEELIGKKSANHILEKSDGMVVGIERNGKTTESDDLILQKIFYGWWVIKENEQIL
jgi:hypothetical protein